MTTSRTSEPMPVDIETERKKLDARVKAGLLKPADAQYLLEAAWSAHDARKAWEARNADPANFEPGSPDEEV